MKRVFIPSFILVLTILACGQATPTATPVPVGRYSLLPDVKYGPETDFWPPTAVDGWTQPVPLPYPVNTTGGEDGPFLLPDGQTFLISSLHQMSAFLLKSSCLTA